MKRLFYSLVLILGLGAAYSPLVLAGFGSVDHVSNINVIGTSGAVAGGSSQLLDTVKNFINRMLGMLATIALVICLWAGFQMVTAAGDDGKYKKGMTILKQAGMGLVIIGLAWSIVSVVFWLVSAMQ
ncbi:MAG: pilin [Candidatus Peribacteria bacterium]|jgi:hypothetical protein|nr:pilin [Candidatus Peribacteria bacterium]